jgi:hypothetical protein
VSGSGPDRVLYRRAISAAAFADRAARRGAAAAPGSMTIDPMTTGPLTPAPLYLRAPDVTIPSAPAVSRLARP